MGPETESICYIPTNRGAMVRISACDYDRFSIRPIYIAKKPRSCGYAFVSVKVSHGKFRSETLHRLIMNPPKGLVVDHINGDTLDNRRENLRTCSVAENSRNKRRKCTSTSPYKGVTWDKSKGKWKSFVGRKHLGYFDNPEDAKMCHDEAAKALYGEYFHDGRE